MGRPERPLDPSDGPVAAFAHDLRELRRAAGLPTYAAMGRRAHRSASVLAEAAGGTALPTLDTTLAYVAACGADPAGWTARWHAVRAEAGPDSGPAATTGPRSRDGSTGDRSTGDSSTGDRSTGDRSTGDRSTGDRSTGDRSTGDSSTGDGSTGDGSTGVVAAGRRVPWRPVAALAGVVLAGAAAATWMQGRGPQAQDVRPSAAATAPGATPPAPATTPTPAPTETLTIERPTDGGTVAMLDDVVIRRSGTAPGRHVWILVQFTGGPVTNPQGDCSTQDGVTYLCEKAQFGDPDTTAGTRFGITAIEVDEEGHLALQSLVANGFDPATRPVPYLAESQGVTVSRR